MTTWADLLSSLLAGDALDAAATRWAMGEILAGNASPAQIAGFAIAMRAKGETPPEVSGLVAAMLDAATPWEGPRPERGVDTCGTGGDRSHTVNISTMAAFVVRGAGVTVVKHGNRAASSRSGSADLLEALGVVVDLPPAGAAACLAACGSVFFFAPVWHPAYRHTAAPRRELGVPTVFNILGPLTNPLQPNAQTVGVGEARLAPVIAGVLAARGCDALVFRGDDGLDELTTGDDSAVWVVAGGRVRADRVAPEDVGLVRTPSSALVGGDAEHNAAVARDVLRGQTGSIRDAVLLNAAAAIVAAAGPTGAPVAEQLAAALPVAAAAIDCGAAERALGEWVEASQAAAKLPA